MSKRSLAAAGVIIVSLLLSPARLLAQAEDKKPEEKAG
jgi:hypothetical protein